MNVAAFRGLRNEKGAQEVKAVTGREEIERIVLKVGTNDVGRGVQSEEMLGYYCNLIEFVKEGAKLVSVISVLHRF